MKKHKAMLVDDLPELRAMMTSNLRHLGFVVESFASAPDALSAIGNGYAPGLVVTDYELGDGLKGDDLITALRILLTDCFYILWTAHDHGKQIAEAVSASWLSKSSDRGRLASLLMEAGYEQHP